MDKPTRNPEAGYPLTDLHDDYGEAWKYIEHLEARLGRATAIAKGALRSISEQASRIQVLEAELFKESARGDFLNARNGRLEHEIGMVKPGSSAKKFMEEEYERMKSKVAELEAMVSSGNLCVHQVPVESSSTSDTSLYALGNRYQPVTYNGEDLGVVMAVRIHEEGGETWWRFYRKAGH
jgi:hypothetical protein